MNKRTTGTATALSVGLTSPSSSLQKHVLLRLLVAKILAIGQHLCDGVFRSSYSHRSLRGSPCLLLRL